MGSRKLPPEDEVYFLARFLRKEAQRPMPAPPRPKRKGVLASTLRAIDDATSIGNPDGPVYRRLVLRAGARWIEEHLLPKARGRPPSRSLTKLAKLTGRQLTAALDEAKVPKEKRLSVKRQLRRRRHPPDN
jgi:hypothetical protein